jgi:hypothetical protein
MIIQEIITSPAHAGPIGSAAGAGLTIISGVDALTKGVAVIKRHHEEIENELREIYE